MKKLSIMQAVIASAVLLLAFQVAQAETFKVGAVYPLSGPVAEDGTTVLKGAKLAVKLFNDESGPNGDKIELLVEDGACIPAQSIAAAEKLISAGKVIAFGGAFCSSSTGATMDVALRYKVPMVAGISTAPNLTERGNPYLFRIQATSEMLAKAFAPKMLELAGGKKVAYIVVNDDWGRSVAEFYKAAFERNGATTVSTQIFDTNETDLFAYITNIKRAEPDAIMMAGNTQNAVSLTEQLRQMGIKARLFGEGSFTAKSYYDAVGKKGDGIYGLMPYVSTYDSPVSKKFSVQYQAAYGEPPNNNAAAGFEEMTIIANAIRTVKKADPQAIRDAIAAGTTPGPAGDIKFNEKGQGYGFNVFLTRNANKEPVIESSVLIAKP